MTKPLLESPMALRLGQQRLSAADVDQLIAELAELRCAMQPPVALRFGTVADKLVVQDPDFTTGLTQHGNVLVSFRDPGLGWRTFELTPTFSTALRDALVKWAPRGPGPLTDARGQEH